MLQYVTGTLFLINFRELSPHMDSGHYRRTLDISIVKNLNYCDIFKYQGQAQDEHKRQCFGKC